MKKITGLITGMLEFNSKNPTNTNQLQIRKNHNCTKPLYLNINKSSFVFIIYNASVTQKWTIILQQLVVVLML